jgi:hypothetical protein
MPVRHYIQPPVRHYPHRLSDITLATGHKLLSSQVRHYPHHKSAITLPTSQPLPSPKVSNYPPQKSEIIHDYSDIILNSQLPPYRVKMKKSLLTRIYICPLSSYVKPMVDQINSCGDLRRFLKAANAYEIFP